MYLDYSFWKFPFPTLGEGGKGRSKLSHCIDKPKFLPFIHLSLLSSVVARSVTKLKVVGSNPACVKIFFLDFYILFFSSFYLTLLILVNYHRAQRPTRQAQQRLVVNTPTLLIDLVCKPPFLFSPVETTLLLTSEGTHPPDPRGSSGISPKSGDGVDKIREIEISLISDIIFCKFR